MASTDFITRVFALICVVLLTTMAPSAAARAEVAHHVPELRVGVLEFGSVGCEIDKVQRLGLARKHGIRLALVLADRLLFLGDTPARVVLDYRVEQTGSHDVNGPEVAALTLPLLARHPLLLSGAFDAGADETSYGKEGL